MKTFFKWLLPALVVVEVALVWLRLLSLATAIVLVVALEAALFLVALRQVVAAVKVYRRDRGSGMDGWVALEGALGVFMPRKAARVLVLEPRLWYCLGKWLLRRTRHGSEDFSYHGKSVLGLFLVLLLFTTPAEVFLIELLLPWAWLRWVLLVLAVYAFFWAGGFYASLVALQHRLTEKGAIFRYGAFARAEVPYAEVVEVALERAQPPARGDGLRVADSSAFLSVGGRTNVLVRLRRPLALEGWLGPTAPVNLIRISADEPDRLVREMGSRLAAVQAA